MIHVARRDNVRRHNAFTVVELLVVIAIIGVLVSILLPAIGAVRDSARRTQNANNLKNIGTAVIAYEEANGTFPPLMKRSKRDPEDLTKSVSWAFEILPFVEQDNIYKRFDDTQSCFAPVNKVAMGTAIEIYANPRVRDAQQNRQFAKATIGSGASLDYAANGGTVVDKKERMPVLLPSDRPSVDSLYPFDQPFDPKFSGPFHPSQAIASAAVRDGLSNTLCAGDRWIGPPIPPGQPQVNDLAGLAGDSFYTIVRFANRDTNSTLPFPINKTDPSVFKFGSPKGSDACFVFLDGRVQWVPYDVDLTIFQALASINDGYPIPANWN